MKLPVLTLKISRKGSNPLFFAKMVNHPPYRLDPGALVEVRDRDGRFVGRGFYHPLQTIALRLLTELEHEEINEEFFYEKLKQAKIFREDVLGISSKSDSYRLIHGEADGLTGMVIDKFGDVIIIEPFSAGVLAIGKWLIDALTRLYPSSKIAVRANAKIEKNEKVNFEPLTSRFPAPTHTVIRENGLHLRVDFLTGHKTGYFLDQRDNRLAVSKLAQNAEVLDLFCYTGGFGLTALKHGARKVTCVDLDEKAIAIARNNAKHNQLPQKNQQLEFIHRDVFDFLREKAAKKEFSDVVIVDPAKLAGVRDELSVAIRKYGDLNKLAISVVKPGGILVTCSCSGMVSEEKFLSVISNSAHEVDKTLQIFQINGASPDHPFSSRFPQGRYLKAVFARVL